MLTVLFMPGFSANDFLEPLANCQEKQPDFFLIIAVGIGIGCAVLFNMAKETFKK